MFQISSKYQPLYFYLTFNVMAFRANSKGSVLLCRETRLLTAQMKTNPFNLNLESELKSAVNL